MPTFGQTGTGDTADNTIVNYKGASRFQAPANGIVTKLSFYCWIKSGAPVVKGMIYSDKAGPAPDALLGTSAEATVPASAAWVDLTGGTIGRVVTPGTYYWLTYIVGGTGYIYDKAQTSATQCDYNSDTYSDGPSNPFGTTEGPWASHEYCIYATYTPTGSRRLLVGVGL